MNINQAAPYLQSLAAEAQVSGVAKMSNAPKPTLVPSRNDHANLSEAASLANQAASLPDVRSEKVGAVKSTIANGSYSVSSEDVAQSMMDHMLGGKE